MLNEVIEALSPRNGETYIDGTLGAGGYTKAILKQSPECRVIGIDRDTEVVARLRDADPRLSVVHGCFGDLDLIADGEEIDGVVLDIGVSSMQIDDFGRGFSFRGNGPLDMRMDTSCGETAADIVNNADEKELEKIFREYGQERFARKVAAAIVKARSTEEIKTTGQLADIIRSVVPKSKVDLQDPATRCFQALRIAVNDELGELQRGLAAAEKALKPGGRLVVVSFHSLEDGIVKSFLLERSGNNPRGSRYLPEVDDEVRPSFELKSRKSLKPSEKEIVANPRSRSARLRWAVRTDAPAWNEGGVQ
jgi:16S rRNA (cytosine1402-N4)-methyltransferase